MSAELPTVPKRPPVWERWKFGVRVLATVSVGLLLSWFAVGLFAGFVTLTISLVLPKESAATIWIARVVLGFAVLYFLPLLMYNWCSIWGLPGIASFVGSGSLKKDYRVPPQS